jgi:Uncharacterized protein conserved in bacteria (DUF2263)
VEPPLRSVADGSVRAGRRRGPGRFERRAEPRSGMLAGSMAGRARIPEEAFRGGPHDDPIRAARRAVLWETVAALEGTDRWQRLAAQNLARWAAEAQARPRTPARPRVIRGDWGEVTRELTRTWGTRFAALNMANPHVPGGGYVEGSVAQEENMFRRTDCHLAIEDSELERASERYRPEMTERIEGRHGRVVLDVERPRVCVRGAETPRGERLGYDWLPDDEVFPFYELRAAAQICRDGVQFDPAEARRRIAAQLDTLVDTGVRHAVLGAFGCGAFRNPAEVVARIYREELERRPEGFECVVFAIYDAGYGPDNATPFEREFG